jgi:hypothetical protein
MEARHARQHAQTQEMMSGMDSLIRGQRIARVVQNALFRGGGLLGL